MYAIRSYYVGLQCFVDDVPADIEDTLLAVNHDAGIIDQNIQPAKPGLNAPDRCLDAILV